MPSLLEPDYEKPFGAWKAAPTPANAGALLSAVRPVIDSAIKSYAGGDASPILVSRARRMALDAFGTYNPALAGLKTHLTSRLQGLRRTSADLNDIIHVPEQIRLDRGHLMSAASQLRDELGRDPTDLELSDRTGLSAKRLAHVRKAGMPAYEGTLAEAGEDGPIEPVVRQADDDVWAGFVYHSLTPTDRLILEHSLGMNGKPRLGGRKLAAMLGVTPAAISQRKAKIQSMLDQRQNLGVL